jgi:hypothetical protein
VLNRMRCLTSFSEVLNRMGVLNMLL